MGIMEGEDPDDKRDVYPHQVHGNGCSCMHIQNEKENFK